MTTIDERGEDLRRAGLFFGVVILGFAASNMLYGIAHGTSRPFLGTTRPAWFSLGFVAAGAVIAWRMQEPVGRAAWIVFAIQHAFMAWAAMREIPVEVWTRTGLTSAFAALLTVSGARRRTTQTLRLAGLVFLLAVCLSYGVRYYADVVLGNGSVVSG